MTLYKMSQYFPKSYEPFGGDINVRLDLSNYATKDDIKNITHVDTSSFALKTNLANLKSEVDKLDIDKLKPIPTDLSKLSNVAKNDVVKKTDCNKLVTIVDTIDTSFVKKTGYNTKITEIEDKIHDSSSFVQKTDYNTKITEMEDKISNTSKSATITALATAENKIRDTSNLATKTALTTVENKMPDISNLATKSTLTALENKIPDINSLVKKNITNIENNVRQLQAYDLSYFKSKQYFVEGSGKQNYLVFSPLRKYFKLNSVAGVIDHVLSWQSKGLLK